MVVGGSSVGRREILGGRLGVFGECPNQSFISYILPKNACLVRASDPSNGNGRSQTEQKMND